MTPEQLEAEFLRLSSVGEFDKIQRILRSYREQVPRDVVAEIFQEACLEVVERQRSGGTITNVAGLIVTIGKRKLARVWEQIIDGMAVDAVLARRLEEGDWRHDERRQAQIDRAVDYVFKAVADWPVDNYRRALLTVVDAAAEGLQLEPKDLGELLGCNKDTARMWRNRAYDRLRVQFEKDGISWEEVTGLLLASDDGDVIDQDDDKEEM